MAIAQVQVGPDLPQPIVDFFVPPTRSSEPYVATAQSVYRFDKKTQQWTQIYSPSEEDQVILGIEGYAKSSKVLYVAHTRGIARTKNSGESWNESVPIGFEKDHGQFIGLVVNRTNRKRAYLAYQKSLWMTHDYGESFEPVAMPSDSEEFSTIGLAEDHLVATTANTLYSSSDAGQTWISLLRSPEGPGELAVSHEPPLAFTVETGVVRAYDLLRPGFQQVVTVDGNNEYSSVAVDSFGRGIVWSSSGNDIKIIDLKAESVDGTEVYRSDIAIGKMVSHPREVDSLIWSEGQHLFLIQDGFAHGTDQMPDEFDLSSFTEGQFEILRRQGLAGSEHAEQEASRFLNAVMTSQPPLDQAIGAALEHAFYEHDEIMGWKRKVRKRNWIPQLRLGGGAREWPVDRTFVVSQVDRFGVAEQEDLRLSDSIENLGYVSVALVWDLEKLLFDPEQVDINKEKRYEVKQRNALVSQVTESYYERVDLLVKAKLNAEKMSLSERISLLLEIRQNTDLLNGLCGVPLFQSVIF